MYSAAHTITTAVQLGEKRFAVYIKNLPMPDLKDGWLCLPQHFWQRRVSLREAPRELYTIERARALCDQMLQLHTGIDAHVCEFVPLIPRSRTSGLRVRL